MQEDSLAHRMPTDVTLKMPDGKINAHKLMLAIMSSVFERMFHGNFKEADSGVVDLPKDNCRIIQMLLDAMFKGSCEMDSLDDIIPLMEVLEGYQIKKRVDTAKVR